MNITVRSAVASALALGATSAFAQISLPQTGTSDIVLIVSAFNSSGTDVGDYALNTGIGVGASSGGCASSSGCAMTTNFVTGASLNTSMPGLNDTIGPSSTLSTFLTANSSNTIEWTLEGAQFSAGGAGASNSNVRTAGLGEAVFTSSLASGTNGGLVTTKALPSLVGVLNGLNGDLGSGGLSALLSANETNAATLSTGDYSKNGFFGGQDEGLTGTPLTFFGFTGNGNPGTLQSYVLGTATLAANGTLTITGNNTTPVPVPPALWLFGSGVLGLVGVARRRKAAV